MFKRISWAWVMSPLLTASLLAPQVAFAGQGGQAGNNSGNTGATGGANTSIGIPPSRGDAGFTSGGSSTAGSNTVFSIPVTVFNQNTNVIPGLSDQGVTATVNADGSLIVNVPPALQNALNATGRVAIVDLRQGNLSQQNLANLLSVGLAIANSMQGEVPGGISLTTTTGGQSSTNSYATFQELFNAISPLVGTTGTTFSIQVGDVTVTLN